MALVELKNRKRSDYGFVLDYRTRWLDNDMYDHMNNSVYNLLYDSVINTYLIQHCDMHPPTSSQYGLAVHTDVDFFGSISFPAVAEIGLRVTKIGKSSVRYEVALFERGVEQVRSVGSMIHVFVDRGSGRPAAQGMNDNIKKGLEKILTKEPLKL